MNDQDVNYVEINPSRCKGCGVCAYTCPKKCLEIGVKINKLGYPYAHFISGNKDCTGCGMCFYSCPEFGAITVFKKASK